MKLVSLVFVVCALCATSLVTHAQSDGLPFLDEVESCGELRSVTSGLDLNDPEWAQNISRGLMHTPLYTAFRLECHSLGRTMLVVGADPNLGGIMGSMVLSALSDDNSFNAVVWSGMLMGAGANPEYKSPWGDEVVADLITEANEKGRLNAGALSLYKLTTLDEPDLQGPAVENAE